jgi:hypothetical protein
MKLCIPAGSLAESQGICELKIVGAYLYRTIEASIERSVSIPTLM